MMGSELHDFRTRVDGHVDHLVGLHLAHHSSLAIRHARDELLDLIDDEVEQRIRDESGASFRMDGWLVALVLVVTLAAVLTLPPRC